MSRIRSTCLRPAPTPASGPTVLRLFLALCLVTVLPSVTAQEAADEVDAEATVADPAEGDLVVGTAEEWEEDALLGRRVLKGKVRIDREDGSGHLYTDEVEMLYDPAGDSRKVDTMHARGNVSLREADFTATSDIADFTEGTAVVTLTGSVVVFIDNDRMEADTFRYDRRTGKKNAHGNVKFRFRLPREDEAPAVDAAEEAGGDEAADTTPDEAPTEDASDTGEASDTEQNGGSED